MSSFSHNISHFMAIARSRDRARCRCHFRQRDRDGGTTLNRRYSKTPPRYSRQQAGYPTLQIRVCLNVRPYNLEGRIHKH